MLSALIIVFREVLEMSMVLGMLYAATKGVAGCSRWISGGALIGLMGALIVAYFMEALEMAVEGAGEFIFNAVVLSIASLLLAWTVIWMRKHGREMSMRMREVGSSVAEGQTPMFSLLMVSFAAVMREGSEAVFFLFGAMQTSGTDESVLIGGLLGLLSGAALGILLYQGLVRLPMQHLFQVMGVLLILLASGMASQAALNLVIVDVLPPVVDTLWDSSFILTQESFLGSVLHVMVGYDDQPTGMQMIVFVITLAVISWLYHRAKA